jgi:NTE family protein
MPTKAARAPRKTAASPKKRSDKKRVAIACQGGGSQTAFTAGVLRGLFEAGAHEEFDIVGISGTSGGAICATLAWVSLVQGDAQPWQRLYDFWDDNAAKSPTERAFNETLVHTMRLTNAGRIPSLSVSPSSPMMQMMFWSCPRMSGHSLFAM